MLGILSPYAIHEARKTLLQNPEIIETPTIYSAGLSNLVKKHYGFPIDIYLKLENLQTTRSYKVRGAHNRISKLIDLLGAGGIKRIVTASAGNHAQGVGLAARFFGLAGRTVVYMPEGAPAPKVAGTRQFGVQIRFIPPPFDNAREAALEAAKENGVHFVHPYDDIEVMAGQGTVGLEILDALASDRTAAARGQPPRTTIVCPVGGGGLLAGLATAVRSQDSDIRIIGVEPVESAKTKRSLQSDTPYGRATVATVADGVSVKRLGDNTFEVIRKHLAPDDVREVGENRIFLTMRHLMAEGMVVEGAGALALAALLKSPIGDPHERVESPPLDLIPGERVVLVLSGANLKPEYLAKVIEVTK